MNISNLLRISILLLLLSFNPLYAQKDSSENSLKKGKFAFMFATTDSSLNISSFERATISLKWHLADKIALRLSLIIDAPNQDRRISTRDTLTFNARGFNLYYILNANILFYKPISAKFHFYYGGGLNGSYHNGFRNSTMSTGGFTWSDNIQWLIGINLLTGVEYFPVKFISLFAEYYSIFYYLHDKFEIRDYDPVYYGFHKHIYNSDFLKFDYKNVNLGISVYFGFPF